MSALDKGWLQPGDRDQDYGPGDDVAQWQRTIGVSPADGNFGDLTTAKTKAWQASHGIAPDSLVGPLTIAEAKRINDLPKPPGTPADLLAGSKPVSNPVPDPVTAWASHVLNSPKEFPMGTLTDVQNFSGRKLYARIEQHTWTHRNGKLVTAQELGKPYLRGVTLYEVA